MITKEKVLVIDDSREMLLIMKHLLLNNGYVPLLAENGLEGLQMVGRAYPRPHCAGFEYADSRWLGSL